MANLYKFPWWQRMKSLKAEDIRCHMKAILFSDIWYKARYDFPLRKQNIRTSRNCHDLALKLLTWLSYCLHKCGKWRISCISVTSESNQTPNFRYNFKLIVFTCQMHSKLIEGTLSQQRWFTVYESLLKIKHIMFSLTTREWIIFVWILHLIPAP